MKRRNFLKTIGAASLAMTASAYARTGSKKPNIVIIFSDDHGWGDVGYHGYDDIRTPNIDALAKGGTWFSQGYVSASVCGPSRAGMLTGVYQQRMGVYGNYDKGGIPVSQPTIFEMLKKEGYKNAAVGKWHVGGATEAQRPNSRDVDFFYGFLFGAHDYYTSTTDPHSKKPSEWPIMKNREIQPPIQDSNGYLTDMFTDQAVDFLEKTGDEPFCLYLAYNAVHHPWQVPDKYIERLKDMKISEERRLFAGMVLSMDDGVGRVMDVLRKKGVEDNTLVFFIGDNGTPRGQGIKEPKQKERGQCTMSNPGPFNGFKGDTYEGGIRVPYVAYWPGVLPAGKEYKHPVTALDVVPTAMALVGVDKPHTGLNFDGVDLMPYLTGKKSADEKPHDVMYWRRGEDYAIRKGDWKLEFNDQGGPKTIMLFDMKNDPGEWKDLSSAKPDLAQELQDMFDKWDSNLSDNQSGKNPRNRNSGYNDGQRVNVKEFNANVSVAKPVVKKKKGKKKK